MELEQINALISERTGVPAALLDGQTAEENIAKARAIIEYRSKAKPSAERKLTTNEQFAAWLDAVMPYGEPQDTNKDPAAAELDRIAEELRIANGGYPQMEDGGEVDPSRFPDSRPTSVQFAEWFKQETAFNPRKENGWIPLA